MSSFTKIVIKILVGAVCLMAILPTLAQDTMAEPIVSVQNVIWDADQSVVEDAEAILTRMEHGLSATMTTSGLEPGHVYTTWWIIFNAPENCTDNVCGFDDVFLMDEEGGFILDDNESWQPNFPGRELAQVTSLRAGATIAFPDGTAMFRAHLPIGDLTDDVVFGPGLLNPLGAEVHFAIRTHGPVIPEIIAEQLFTAWGGCPDPLDRSPCHDPQLAIFLPPSQ